MNIEQLSAALEAILFVAGEAVDPNLILNGLNISELELGAAIDHLREKLARADSGLTLKEYQGKLQFTTRPDQAAAIRDVLNPVQKQTLSQSVLETLAIVAYEQPVTRLRLEEVRGVKSDYAVQVLAQRGLIEEVGRLDALGRPILYGTTEEFLRHFGLSSLEELPPLEQFIEPETE